MAIIVSADEIKKEIPGYDPDRSELVHTQSARLADQEFESSLADSRITKVILLCGGGASGKTEYLMTYLVDDEPDTTLVLDGTLSSVQGLQIKLSKIRKAGKSVEIHGILPADIRDAYSAFLGRRRKYPTEYFCKTHAGARKVLLEATSEKYQARGVRVHVYEVEYQKDRSLEFFRIKDIDVVKYIHHIQWTEEEIFDKVK